MSIVLLDKILFLTELFKNIKKYMQDKTKFKLKILIYINKNNEKFKEEHKGKENQH